MPDTAPLSRFPVARTASPGKLRDAVDGLTGYDHAVVRSVHSQGPPHGTVNGRRFADVSLVFVAYATPVSVLAPPTHDQVLLVVPIGPMIVEVDGRRWTMTEAFALSACSDTTMYPDPIAGALVGSVPVATITAYLRECYGIDREFSIDLALRRPIALHSGRALRRAWLDFALPQPSSKAGGSSRAVQGAAGAVSAAGADEPDTSGLIDRLLIGLVPFTNYRADEAAGWVQPPDYLIHAVRHLRRNLAEQVSIATLSDTVGIGSRQLQLAFQAHLGCTAQEYLKKIRLDRAWQLLETPGTETSRTIAEISAEVGIGHQGRFAQYFVERFGVLPSAL